MGERASTGPVTAATDAAAKPRWGATSVTVRHAATTRSSTAVGDKGARVGGGGQNGGSDKVGGDGRHNAGHFHCNM